jgi:hypothetical protein
LILISLSWGLESPLLFGFSFIFLDVLIDKLY